MEAYYEILSRCPLFAGISREEMPEILGWKAVFDSPLLP